MRIGFDAKRAFHNFTGLGNYSRTIIRQLTGIYPENQYFLFTPAESGKFRDFPPENTTVIEPHGPVDRFFPSWWRSFRMGSDITFQQLDLYHGLSNELPRNIRKSRVKSVVTIHDLIFIRYPHLYNRIDRSIYKNKFLSATRLAEQVIAISEQTRSDLITFFKCDPGKIEVVYQGCNPVFYEKSTEEMKVRVRETYHLPQNYILYVGTIEERKNLLQIIKARYELRIDLPLVVIGRPTSYMKKIREYINEKGIMDIYFLDQVMHTDLPPIYQMSSVFVYPSSFEGFGIPVLEALNSGVPVIAATGSCLEETGGLHSIYINPGNTEEIGNALMNILSSSDLREKMISEGYHYALNFREEKTAVKLMEVYKKLI